MTNLFQPTQICSYVRQIIWYRLIIDDFPPELPTNVPQSTRVFMPENNVVFGLKRYDEVFFIALDRYSSTSSVPKRLCNSVGNY
jgi:hypothetical protein